MPQRPELKRYAVIKECLEMLNQSHNKDEALSRFKQLLSLIEKNPEQSFELISFVTNEWPKIKETSPSTKVELKFAFNMANKQVILLEFDNTIISHES